MSVRPENCDPHICDPVKKGGPPVACPHCHQVHLRPGYCQALDPINAEKYPHLHAKAPRLPSPPLAVTDNRNVTDNSRNADTDVTDNESRVCIECDALFVPARSDARYCSTACRMRAARKRIT